MMPMPRATPWFAALAVGVDVDIAAEVHVGFAMGFTPSSDTYRGTLYGPGTVHVSGLPVEVDLYTRLVSLDGEDITESPPPVQIGAGNSY